MKPIDNKTRKEIEAVIYKFFDKLDKTKTNSEFYKKKFSKMDNKEFTYFISLDFPYRFHYSSFKIEPSLTDANNALESIGVPLTEKINLPYYYEDENGNPIQSKECIVFYVHCKKLQQFVTKKNSMSVDIDQRNMKSGLLLSDDKNSKESDREMESLVVSNLNNTMKEFSRHRADSMDAKNVMYNQISTLGKVSLKDAPVEKTDSLSKNMMNAYLIGAHIQTNIINEDYYLPYTLDNKKKSILRV